MNFIPWTIEKKFRFIEFNIYEMPIIDMNCKLIVTSQSHHKLYLYIENVATFISFRSKMVKLMTVSEIGKREKREKDTKKNFYLHKYIFFSFYR